MLKDKIVAMINDKKLKLVFIPLVGITTPLLSQLYSLRAFGLVQNLTSIALFILTSAIIWQGAVMMMLRIRRRRNIRNVFVKVLTTLAFNGLFGFGMAAVAGLLWQTIFQQSYHIPTVVATGLISTAFVLFFTFFYEIIFLTRERELDERVVQHLDRELLDAEVNLLKNELDPHFVYNTLMPLYYLVKNDKQKAELFAYKLIQVYQYFLENKGNDFISLKEEMRFIEDYIFLLQIRYKDGLSVSYSNFDSYQWQILPFSLQLLIENAIKHNSFDKNAPLKISVSIEKNCLVVKNSKCQKKETVSSTRIGLKNLRTRYRLLCNQDLTINEYNDHFVVKVPLIQSLKMNDSKHYNRRRSN